MGAKGSRNAWVVFCDPELRGDCAKGRSSSRTSAVLDECRRGHCESEPGRLWSLKISSSHSSASTRAPSPGGSSPWSSSSSSGRSDEQVAAEVDESSLPCAISACTVRNLDTGEVESLSSNDGTLKEFLGFRRLERGDQLPERGLAWEGWWRTWRQQQLQLWRQAEVGGVTQLTLLLQGLEDRTMPAANVNLPDASGSPALHLAAANGHREAVEVLLQHRADANARSNGGMTALHLACARGHSSCASVLLDAGCARTAATDRGETVLHLAASGGQSKVVRLLLEAGCEDLLAVRSFSGQCPAEACVDIDTASLLRLAAASRRGAPDAYASRTPCEASGSVRRDARADAVRRLLGWSQSSSPACAATRAASSEIGPPARRTTRRKAFLKMSGRGLEPVGPESFYVQVLLGRGAFGEVYKVLQRGTGDSYAMKVLKKSKIVGRRLERYALTERNLLCYLRHPFIVRLHYAFQTSSLLVLILQYCSGGTLAMLIRSRSRLPEVLTRFYAGELFLALEHLHKHQVVYRDLKPENVVLDGDRHALLTDFGLSKEGVEDMRGAKSFCGSTAYLAPEVLAHSGHGPPVDWYGLGVLVFECLSGRPPYWNTDKKQLFRNIASAILQPPADASPEASALIRALLRRDPARRLGSGSASEVKSHAFFDGLDFDMLLSRQVDVPDAESTTERGASSSRCQDAHVPMVDVGGLGPSLADPFVVQTGCFNVFRRAGSPDIAGWDFASHSPAARQAATT